MSTADEPIRASEACPNEPAKSDAVEEPSNAGEPSLGDAAKAVEPSLTKDVIRFAQYHLWRAMSWARPYLGGRRGLILLAIAVLGAGAALNWGWLVAIGIAPILVTVAPCAIMCALGLCMRGGGKTCSSEDQGPKPVSRMPPPKPRKDA